MADNTDDQEKSHPATPRRLEQAREEGQVPRSRELAAALVALAAAGGALWAGPALGARLSALLGRGLTLDRAAAMDPAAGLAHAASVGVEALVLTTPLLILLALAAVAAPLALGGWLFSTKSLAPDLARMSPQRWAGRVFSWNSLAELAKALAAAVLVCAAALGLVWMLRGDLAQLLAAAPDGAIGAAGRFVGLGFLAAAVAMLAVAAADVPIQLYRHYQGLRMSTAELRREAKETEGDPMIKQRIRSQQRAIARRRMMADVPKADVVVTNPAHYAVAISWNESAMRAPRVVAKGTELVAARIKEIAAANNVPVLEAPPLARALHRHAEIGEEIPAALYNAVAQVLAWTFALRAGRAAAAPIEIAIPNGMDPLTAGMDPNEKAPA